MDGIKINQEIDLKSTREDIFQDYKKRQDEILKTLGPGRRLANPLVLPKKVGRNKSCPCGSGKKFKRCCGV